MLLFYKKISFYLIFDSHVRKVTIFQAISCQFRKVGKRLVNMNNIIYNNMNTDRASGQYWF